MNQQNSGFTLIELLVVVCILGILMAILLPALGGAVNNGQNKACMAEIQQIETALRLYELDYRDYPPSTVAELGFSKENGINSGIESLVACLSSSYKTNSYYEFNENKLINSDSDSSPIPLKKLTGSIFKTNFLWELTDPWGNPYVYFHSRNLVSSTGQLYQLNDMKKLTTPYPGESKTGNFPGYGRYQVISCGTDRELHSKDDVRSK